MQKNVVGKFLCDRFYVIPPVKNVKNYLKTLIKICKEENVNVLIPQVYNGVKYFIFQSK